MVAFPMMAAGVGGCDDQRLSGRNREWIESVGKKKKKIKLNGEWNVTTILISNFLFNFQLNLWLQNPNAIVIFFFFNFMC